VFVDDGYDLTHGGPAGQVVAACKTAGLKLMTVGLETGDLCCHLLDPAMPRPLAITFGGRRYATSLPLIGSYQRDNALVAAGLAIAAGCEPGAVFEALAHLEGVAGRLELVARFRDAPILVDYAHKPEALERVLAELRLDTTKGGRLICIVGCGGDRDKGKRPIMGRIATERADVVIVTDDNPRSEDPATIRAEILAGAPGAREIGDRAEAIRAGVAMLRPGDVLLVAGKGHETGQIVGTKVLPFSDHEEIRRAVAASQA
jgi:UDP-N-acetylmuramoyl-L-alanyl-D-glutamate--2,6-diaminopimelate ligase